MEPNIRKRSRPLQPLLAGELIQRTAEGDHDAFAALYQRFARPVLGLALRRLGDRQRAEDVTQETFAAIWRSAASYRPERGPGAPWLYAVARNAVVNQTRFRTEPASEVVDVASNEPGLLDQAESEWVSRRVHGAVRELPEEQRTLIELAYWHGLSQSEIGTRLNIPLGTVKTRTRAALARLAELLEPDQLR